MMQKKPKFVAMNTPPPKIVPITGISLGVLSAAEIRNLSEGELTTISEQNHREDPIFHSRQGAYLGQKNPCVVCSSKKVCPGHPMHIELEYPVIKPYLMPYVHYVLSCICPRCHRCIYPESKCAALGIKSSGLRRIKAIQKRLKKDETCFYDDCQALLPKYIIKGPYIHSYYDEKPVDEESQKKPSTRKKKSEEEEVDINEKQIERKEKEKEKKDNERRQREDKVKKAVLVNPNYIFDLFRKMSQEDFDNLGFNSKLPQNPIYYQDYIQVRARQEHRFAFRPEDMLFTAFPIASKIISSTNDDEEETIPAKYKSILKTNVKLKKHREGIISMEEGEKSLAQATLTEDVWVVVDNTTLNKTQPHNHKVMKTYMHVIKGNKNKTALQRANTQGKRVDCNARAVIGPGPFQKPWQLGVPKNIAQVLLNENKVTTWNINTYQDMIDRQFSNKDAEEEIEYIVPKNPKNNNTRQTRYVLGFMKEKPVLEIGDMVGVKLHDKNWIQFNRQPSLRIEAIQGFETKILPRGKGYRVPLSTVTTFNADFDGNAEHV